MAKAFKGPQEHYKTSIPAHLSATHSMAKTIESMRLSSIAEMAAQVSSISKRFHPYLGSTSGLTIEDISNNNKALINALERLKW
jgi:hypothetical protein